MLDDPVARAALGTVLAGVPMSRGASADEVASLVAFLLSDECSYSTGSEFVIDGGMGAGKHVPTGGPA